MLIKKEQQYLMDGTNEECFEFTLTRYFAFNDRTVTYRYNLYKNLNKNSVFELKKLCKYLKLNNYSKLDKSELIELISQCIIFE